MECHINVSSYGKSGHYEALSLIVKHNGIHFDDLFPEESTQECSICHAEQYLRYGDDDNYCPNCGAKMKQAGKG